MNRQSRKFRAKSHIMGGGISVHAGEIVDESRLGGYREYLERAGGIEEVEENHTHRNAHRDHPGR